MRFIRLHPWVLVAAVGAEVAGEILFGADSDEERAAAPDAEATADDFAAYNENLAAILSHYGETLPSHSGAQQPACCRQPASCCAPACDCKESPQHDLILDPFTEALLEDNRVRAALKLGGGTCPCVRS